ncbi:MAG TPA: PhzF family phenazine biosynthesis protein [Anaerolineaceae bacterium]|nr:PhzF family phenazine biosynthesis protein [Anaerolineaceae bacterium]
MTALPLYQVDAFTDQPFKGNPAGVCLLDQAHPEGWMQALAAELKHSETAFLLPEADGYRLRWFTPAAEVKLCGHGTLASAHVLFETGRVEPQGTACFYTLSGLLTACQSDGWTELNFPATQAQPAAAPEGMLAALGISEPLFVGKNGMDYLVEVAEEDQVRALKPDFAALKSVPARGVIVTTRGGGEFDFVSRFFAPFVGVNEDPVTGSAHCTLAPYWSAKLGKDQFTAYQASPRGGVLRLLLAGGRVLIRGQAVTILEGELRV